MFRTKSDMPNHNGIRDCTDKMLIYIGSLNFVDAYKLSKLLIRNEKVGGSIPLSGTIKIKHLAST